MTQWCGPHLMLGNTDGVWKAHIHGLRDSHCQYEINDRSLIGHWLFSYNFTKLTSQECLCHLYLDITSYQASDHSICRAMRSMRSTEERRLWNTDCPQEMFEKISLGSCWKRNSWSSSRLENQKTDGSLASESLKIIRSQYVSRWTLSTCSYHQSPRFQRWVTHEPHAEVRISRRERTFSCAWTFSARNARTGEYSTRGQSKWPHGASRITSEYGRGCILYGPWCHTRDGSRINRHQWTCWRSVLSPYALYS